MDIILRIGGSTVCVLEISQLLVVKVFVSLFIHILTIINNVLIHF